MYPMLLRSRRAALTALALLVAVIAPVGTVRADVESDAPSRMIDQLDHDLLNVMQHADTLGYAGRYKLLEPAIDRTFNVSFMTQVVVGSPWASWSPEQRTKLTDAFRRFIIATYARRFDGFSGESFTLNGTRPANGGVLVMTEIVRPNDTPITLNYQTRDDGTGTLKVVDVFLTGTISELATRRSEFGAVLQRDGYDGLLAALVEKAENQATQ
jgi:phospholipid transport system substrate-binding protein